MTGNSDTFTLAQIADIHSGRSIRFPSGEVDLHGQLEITVNTLLNLDPSPDAVVVTGDLANHGHQEDYEQVRKELDRLPMPYYIAAGNHDRRNGLLEVFPEHCSRQGEEEFLQYTVEQYPLRLVILDTLEPNTHYGKLCEQRLQWLDKTLSQEPERMTMIFMHHPPFATGMPYPDNLGLIEKEGLEKIIRKHPQVEGVASGHTHREAVMRWCNTTAYITPSCTFSYALEFHEVDDLDPLLEPPAFRLFRFDPRFGMISHLVYTGTYEFGITEGVPVPPEN